MTAVRADKAPPDRAAVLAFRRRVVAAAAARRPKRIARAAPPDGIATAYASILVAVSRAMDKAIMSTLRARGAFRRDSDERTDASPGPRPNPVYTATYAGQTFTTARESVAVTIGKKRSGEWVAWQWHRTQAAGERFLAGQQALPPSKSETAIREWLLIPAGIEPVGPSPTEIDRLVRYLTRKLGDASNYRSLAGSLDRMASRLLEYSRAQWRTQLKGAIGIDLASDPDLSKLVAAFRKRQGELIVSLAEDKVQRVKTILREQGADPRVEVLQDRIAQATGATESRARLIARTETTTFNSQLTQARHVAAGITEFVWSTSRDERVRETHAELDGQRFSYDKPPDIPGEGRVVPGQIWNCRCTALPVLPGIDE